MFPKAFLAFPLSTLTAPLFCRKLSEERPEVMLNQFPCENLLTVKDCLASISRRAGGPDGPRWLPRTFNLQTELPQFICYFQQRERRWLLFLLPYILCFCSHFTLRRVSCIWGFATGLCSSKFDLQGGNF